MPISKCVTGSLHQPPVASPKPTIMQGSFPSSTSGRSAGPQKKDSISEMDLPKSFLPAAMPSLPSCCARIHQTQGGALLRALLEAAA
eukprot:4233828-Pleurochrysis_carterae.AAC.1